MPSPASSSSSSTCWAAWAWACCSRACRWARRWSSTRCSPSATAWWRRSRRCWRPCRPASSSPARATTSRTATWAMPSCARWAPSRGCCWWPAACACCWRWCPAFPGMCSWCWAWPLRLPARCCCPRCGRAGSSSRGPRAKPCCAARTRRPRCCTPRRRCRDPRRRCSWKWQPARCKAAWRRAWSARWKPCSTASTLSWACRCRAWRCMRCRPKAGGCWPSTCPWPAACCRRNCRPTGWPRCWPSRPARRCAATWPCSSARRKPAPGCTAPARTCPKWSRKCCGRCRCRRWPSCCAAWWKRKCPSAMRATSWKRWPMPRSARRTCMR